MKTSFVIKIDMMKQKSGSVSAYCEKHNLDRKEIYRLNGITRFNSEKSKVLASELMERGLASWEVVKNECVA
jgi:hypothetical protein